MSEATKAKMRRELILRFCWYTMNNLTGLLAPDDPMIDVLTDCKNKLFEERTKYNPKFEDWAAVGSRKSLWGVET